MTNVNDFTYAMLDPNGQYTQYGLTKREYFAVHATEHLPSWFCQKFIRDKEKAKGSGYRKTDGNYYDMLTYEERVEVRAKWRVACADALIKALNETPQP